MHNNSFLVQFECGVFFSTTTAVSSKINLEEESVLECGRNTNESW